MLLALVAMLAAAEAEAEERGAGFVALTGSVSLPLERTGVPYSAGIEAGFEPIPPLRVTFASNFFTRTSSWGLRVLSGLEAVIAPWLPLEVTAGGLVGFGYGGFSDVGIPFFTAQVRAGVGYRIGRWFSMGVLATANCVLPYTVLWAELGARLAFRW